MPWTLAMGKAKILSNSASQGNVFLMKRLVLVKSIWNSATEFTLTSYSNRGHKHS